MSLLYGNRDRAKASEHALFMVRELAAPAPVVASTLARVANRRAELAVTLGASEWHIRMQTADDGGVRDVFEGIIRLERSSPAATHVILVGRFLAAPMRDQDREARNRDYDLAEDAVTSKFESFLTEISSELAAEQVRSARAPAHA